MTILNGLCRSYGADRLRLVLVDPKGTELNGFEDDPHLDGEIGWDATHAREMLEAEVEEMQRRYQLFREHRCRDIASYNSKVDAGERVPWRLLVLDEYADLTGDPEDRKPIESNLRRLAQKARASGIHLIVATQKPSAEILSTSIRSNFPAQLALRVKTSQDSRIVMDETGAETLAGKGDAFLKTAKSTDRIQVAS